MSYVDSASDVDQPNAATGGSPLGNFFAGLGSMLGIGSPAAAMPASGAPGAMSTPPAPSGAFGMPQPAPGGFAAPPPQQNFGGMGSPGGMGGGLLGFGNSISMALTGMPSPAMLRRLQLQKQMLGMNIQQQQAYYDALRNQQEFATVQGNSAARGLELQGEGVTPPQGLITDTGQQALLMDRARQGNFRALAALPKTQQDAVVNDFQSSYPEVRDTISATIGRIANAQSDQDFQGAIAMVAPELKAHGIDDPSVLFGNNLQDAQQKLPAIRRVLGQLDVQNTQWQRQNSDFSNYTPAPKDIRDDLGNSFATPSGQTINLPPLYNPKTGRAAVNIGDAVNNGRVIIAPTDVQKLSTSFDTNAKANVNLLGDVHRLQAMFNPDGTLTAAANSPAGYQHISDVLAKIGANGRATKWNTQLFEDKQSWWNKGASWFGAGYSGQPVPPGMAKQISDFLAQAEPGLRNEVGTTVGQIAFKAGEGNVPPESIFGQFASDPELKTYYANGQASLRKLLSQTQNGLLSQNLRIDPNTGQSVPTQPTPGLVGRIQDAQAQPQQPQPHQPVATPSAGGTPPGPPAAGAPPAAIPGGAPPISPPAAPASGVAMPASPAEQGLPPGYIDREIGVESGGRNIHTQGNSSADGYSQMTQGTWARYAARVGANPNQPPSAATYEQQRAAAALLTQDNMRALQSSGVQITDGSLYSAHVLGPGGARILWTANPNAPVTSIGLDPRAIANNRAFFVNPGFQPKTVAEARQAFEARIAGAKMPAPAAGTPAAMAPGTPAGLFQPQGFTPQPDQSQTPPAASSEHSLVPPPPPPGEAWNPTQPTLTDKVYDAVQNMGTAAMDALGARRLSAADMTWGSKPNGKNFDENLRDLDARAAEQARHAPIEHAIGTVIGTTGGLALGGEVLGTGGVAARLGIAGGQGAIAADQGHEAQGAVIGAAAQGFGESLAAIAGPVTRMAMSRLSGAQQQSIESAARMLVDPAASQDAKTAASDFIRSHGIDPADATRAIDAVNGQTTRATASTGLPTMTEATAGERLSVPLGKAARQAKEGFEAVPAALPSQGVANAGQSASAVERLASAGFTSDSAPNVAGFAQRLDNITAKNAAPQAQYTELSLLRSNALQSARGATGTDARGFQQVANIADEARRNVVINALGGDAAKPLLDNLSKSNELWSQLKNLVGSTDIIGSLASGASDPSLSKVLLNAVRVGKDGSDAAVTAVRNFKSLAGGDSDALNALQTAYVNDAFGGARSAPELGVAARRMLGTGADSAVAKELLSPEQLSALQKVAQNPVKFRGAFNTAASSGHDSSFMWYMTGEAAHMMGFHGVGTAIEATKIASSIRDFVRFRSAGRAVKFSDLIKEPSQAPSIAGLAGRAAIPAASAVYAGQQSQ